MCGEKRAARYVDVALLRMSRLWISLGGAGTDFLALVPHRRPSLEYIFSR